jgi:hypothetical protein
MNEVSSSPASAPRRWPQFSLKTLMWLVLLAAAFLSGWSVAYRQAREAEALARREAEMARMAELEARDVAKKHALESLRLMAQGREKETAEDNVAKAIKAVLRLQADAWNAGDIERFMDHYWEQRRPDLQRRRPDHARLAEHAGPLPPALSNHRAHGPADLR